MGYMRSGGGGKQAQGEEGGLYDGEYGEREQGCRPSRGGVVDVHIFYLFLLYKLVSMYLMYVTILLISVAQVYT